MFYSNLLSNYARMEDRRPVLRSGFQIHLPKPVESAELVAAVAILTNRFYKGLRFHVPVSLRAVKTVLHVFAVF